MTTVGVDPYGNPVNAAYYSQPGMGGHTMIAQPNPMMMGQMGMMMNMPALPVDVMCRMSALPVNVTCPFCQTATTTTIERVTGGRAYFMICMMTMACLPCILCCIWDGLKDVVHYCGNCKQELGRHIPVSGGGGGRRRR